MPRPCAIRWISSQRSAPALPVKRRFFWTRAEKISAPPPGIVLSPAAMSRLSTSVARASAPPEVVDLGRGEGLDLDLGPGGVDGLDEALVVLERPVGMVAADDVDLADVRLDHADDVLDRLLERALLALLLGVVAERAGEDADVGRVDVAVDHEVDPVAGLLALDVIRHAAEREQVVGLEAGQAVVEVEPLASAHLVPHASEPRVRDAKVVHDGAHAASTGPGVGPQSAENRLPVRKIVAFTVI